MAENGQEALALLRSGDRPAAMLLDRDMPVMNGSELLRIIRADRELSILSVICMSGREWAEAGGRFLSKPFEADALFAMLSHVNAR